MSPSPPKWSLPVTGGGGTPTAPPRAPGVGVYPRPDRLPRPATVFGIAVLVGLAPDVAGFAPEMVAFANLLVAVVSFSAAVHLKARKAPAFEWRSVLILAAIAFAWIAASLPIWGVGPAARSPIFVAVLMNAAVAGFAIWLVWARNATDITMALSDGWLSEDMGHHAIWLLKSKPGPGSGRISRMLLALAAEEIASLSQRQLTPEHLRILDEYADVLENGIGGRAEPEAAAEWRLAVDAARRSGVDAGKRSS